MLLPATSFLSLQALTHIPGDKWSGGNLTHRGLDFALRLLHMVKILFGDLGTKLDLPGEWDFGPDLELFN